ncbi:hypothetical protein ACHAXT_002204 [Thalassiosira profunda]
MRLVPPRLLTKSGSLKARRRNAIAKHSLLLGSKTSSGRCVSELDWETLNDGEAPTKHYHDWARLAGVLSSGESDPTILATLSQEFHTGCVLHRAIEHGAPDNVSMLLARRFSIFLTQCDERGRNLVHISCAHGTSPEFLSHCLDKNPSSASATDVDGNAPIHLLCQSTFAKSDATAEGSVKEILQLLYSAAPATIVVEDNSGKAPVELAIESGLDMSIIGLIHEMIARFNEYQSKTGRREDELGLSGRRRQDELSLSLSRRVSRRISRLLDQVINMNIK